MKLQDKYRDRVWTRWKTKRSLPESNQAIYRCNGKSTRSILLHNTYADSSLIIAISGCLKCRPTHLYT